MIGKSDSPHEISLYFHIPFCKSKCHYCHFFVLPDKAALKEQFLTALFIEWEMRLPQLKGKRIVSIYFGGGTPSRLEAFRIASILQLIRDSDVEISDSCEISLEANPEDVSLSYITELKECGINRISLGIQSLNDEDLTTLSRGHSSQTAAEAVKIVHQAGISNISIDLMYELPKQTLIGWKHTLSQLEDLPITHLSLYNLGIEPHTIFFKKREQLIPLLPNPELALKMLELAVSSLEKIGLKRYEISAFAKNGLYSRHNTGYWIGRPFLGFGPSAFSYWNKQRFRNVAHLNRYAEALKNQNFPVDFSEELPFPRNLLELLAVQLRLCEGVDLSHFQSIHGHLPLTIESLLHSLESKGWLKKEGNCISLTAVGQLFYDSVAAEII